MQKKSLFTIIFASIIGIFLFFLTLSVEHVYDYARIEQKIKMNSSFSGTLHGEVVLEREMSSFVLALPEGIDTEPVHVTWHIDGVDYVRHIDVEMSDDTGKYYTAPIVTGLRDRLAITIDGITDDIVPELIATDTLTYRRVLYIGERLLLADASPNIVSRSQWGADESLTYRSIDYVNWKISEWESRGKTPRIVELTPANIAANKKESEIGKILQESHPESFSVVTKNRTENGRKLIWPILHSRAVDRIVVHHTAETPNQAGLSDMDILRAIYIYHARTRGWGDIGYNYIVGKDGTIYEGRKGGLYSDGAHAYANNLGTVGIAVMGNFDTSAISSQQLQGLEDISVFLAKTYGINVLAYTTGFRTCDASSAPGCIIETERVHGLHGHTDVGYTACPGENLYSLLGDLRLRVASRVGEVSLVMNTEPIAIESIRPEDQVTYVSPSVTLEKKQITKKSLSTRVTPSYGGKNISIKLSYPRSDSISLSIMGIGRPTISVDNKSITREIIKNIEVGIVGKDKLSVKIAGKEYTGSTITYSAPVVRIDSWDRIPTWDTSKKYNDNLFRGKILLYNQDGKLLVVNELSLEDYIRGLGEVSNSENPEKIKVISVAARTYARYYMEPQNRKYGTNLYDGSDDPDSFQKYLGYSYELRSPNVSLQVKETRGEVITYNDKIIKAWYFSSSDGRTRSYREYCEENTGKICDDIPYLQSVADPAGVGKTRYGHGVGISGIGTAAMAEAGKSYKEIIQYYMNGVAIEKK